MVPSTNRFREPTQHGFNWGYDPLNYNVPEGSYSTDPYDGAVRIRECKQMIQSLHAAGIKVIMDVVYNHMFSTDNWFERMIPGYALRRRADGTFADGSACTNDVATEHPMMRKYIVDSVVYWAREYHVDGFRFDLMGLIDVETMNVIRTALDQLPDGATILMHGEPWTARETALEPGTILADKRGMPYLGPRIGAFCDSTRDTVRGHVFYQWVPGYLTGAAADYAEDIRHAEDAWRGTLRETASVGQVVQYVSAHDDLTLWDKLCASMRRVPTDVDYDAQDESSTDLIRRQPFGRRHRVLRGRCAVHAFGRGVRAYQARRLRFVLQPVRPEPVGLAAGAAHGRVGESLCRADSSAPQQSGLLWRGPHDRAAYR